MSIPRFRKGEFSVFLGWFETRAVAVNMRPRRIPLHELEGRGWEFRYDDQKRLVKIESTKGFGAIVGAEVYGGNRETPDWCQIEWGEDEGGPVLIVHDEAEAGHPILLRALAQPGHDGLRVPGRDGSIRNSRVCLGPSANFSWANFMNFAQRVPFGSQIADFELYQPDDEATGKPQVDGKGVPVMKTRNVRLKPEFSFQIGSADGARVDGLGSEDAGKSNFYLDWCAGAPVIDPLVAKMANHADYAWVDRALLREVLRTHQIENRTGYVNEHLRAVLTNLI